MFVVRARFDGIRIILPEDLPRAKPGEVVVVFNNEEADSLEREAWMKVQEAAFAKVWDNDEDAVYDSL